MPVLPTLDVVARPGLHALPAAQLLRVGSHTYALWPIGYELLPL